MDFRFVKTCNVQQRSKAYVIFIVPVSQNVLNARYRQRRKIHNTPKIFFGPCTKFHPQLWAILLTNQQTKTYPPWLQRQERQTYPDVPHVG